ncbi:MAG: hypothetical protein A2W61_03625 [Deltaproteobacteria bacterium RIFCSPLOWO2_01_44_7]|nr:MAG: hypothetical protein A2712_08470 [Deltaproteobacteria bacterium RIFCSPHIGHO2_01_FULL_43_49]OGQ14628.1 MAG: hypothetical protein A3D22_08530 [Deltaproteobacteria bacterium RIFCSPHIGHO2_02_FULL_44_53]OGQ28014.1 MAG: hypothetical protein A3D98_07240 [Deltaproteobacteria bacterium RIFCSPHIGHO2_12_FULL_44_21]OGQ31226.1 MAG: hypothetical protein A2979_07290 [Deltaproteobacteria bacterium RIFCSPLOWO2_01_FULL_45_74]OGQ42701.1 MAG: hypothetical protein A2W61_03625 [Deltaproteobacteria bacterium 
MFLTQIPLGWVLAGFFGLCVGSFINVVIYRLPLDQSVVTPRSHCPNCKTKIAWYDNIPLLSYILLRGKCRYCKQTIAFQYFLVELCGLFLSLAAFAYFQELLLYLAYFCLLLAPLLAVIFIDLKHRIIPDSISLPGIGAGFLVHFLDAPPMWGKEALLESLVGMLVGGGFLFLVAFLYEKIKKKEGLGGGDVKLAAMLGAFFGWQQILMILLVSSVLGSLIGLIVVAFKKDWQYALPFGPFLAVAATLQLFFGFPMLSWYLSLFHG